MKESLFLFGIQLIYIYSRRWNPGDRSTFNPGIEIKISGIENIKK